MVVDDTTVPLSMAECIQGSPIGQATVSGSQVTLKHSGDSVTLQCPATMSKVYFDVRKMWKQHQQFQWPRPNGSTEIKTEATSITLKTGETHVTDPIKEQYLSTGQTIFGIVFPNGMYIENMDVTITLIPENCLDLAGKPPVINPAGFQFVWTITDSTGKVLATGTETSLAEAKAKIETYIKDHENDVFTCVITDAMGNVQYTHEHHPAAGEFPWLWVAVAIAVIAVVAVILLLYMRSGHTAPAAGPAAAPAPTAIIVATPAVS